MIRYINEHIRKSEEKRLKGLSQLSERISPSDYSSFEAHSLRSFVQWYIQRSLNSQWRYGEEFVRNDLREIDRKSGSISMDAAKSWETSLEGWHSQAKDTADDECKTEKAPVRSARYQSDFGGM